MSRGSRRGYLAEYYARTLARIEAEVEREVAEEMKHPAPPWSPPGNPPRPPGRPRRMRPGDWLPPSNKWELRRQANEHLDSGQRNGIRKAVAAAKDPQKEIGRQARKYGVRRDTVLAILEKRR